MSKKNKIPRIRIEAPPILKVPDKDLTREQRKDAARAKQVVFERKAAIMAS
jgi:hypothetical protein